jgi:two-component system sensor histidine kinase CiaH
MFQSATIKLTAWYLALIMGLSLAFSVVLFNSSAESLSVAYDHQRMAIRQQFFTSFGFTPSAGDLDRLRDREISSGQQRLLANLTLANIGVLVVGGLASFYMARRTLRPLEQTMEAQARFTADASHELRTPLTAMQTEIEVSLRDKNMSVDEARELLESNLEEVMKLQDLSNGLLALANQDEEHFVPKKVSTAEALKGAVDRTAKAAKQKKITIENQAEDLQILGSKDGLVQLFAILLDNAIKYSPSGSAITLITAVKGSSALISVIDKGHGIKADDLPHIFERLYRADSSRTKGKVNGYGLGLSIAKKIVELHKGAIDVTSKVGHGSTFTVRIPMAPKDEEKSAEA